MADKKLKVALVHDSLLDFGGGERVLLALHEIWPEAPLFVSVAFMERMGKLKKAFDGWKIIPSWFQKLPFSGHLISPLRFLLPLIWESFDFSGYDLVISSSSWGMSKSVVTPADTLHICYCHTPPRFLYGYPEARKWTKYWPVKVSGQIINHYLRHYDFVTSRRVDYFIANSREVASRIQKFYRREAEVINPPVDIPEHPTLKRASADAPYLFAGRLYSYKHPEWAVAACLALKRPLVVAGDGPLREEIEKMSKGLPLIKILGRVTDQELWRLYQNCRAFFFPVEEEDFGIMPLEAQGFGKPVIALWSGGAKETVVKGKTGVFFTERSAGGLKEAILDFEKHEKDFSPVVIHRWAKQFSKENFQAKIRKFIAAKLKENA